MPDGPVLVATRESPRRQAEPAADKNRQTPGNDVHQPGYQFNQQVNRGSFGFLEKAHLQP